MEEDFGASPGSHASTEPSGLGPAGFDPARIIEVVEEGGGMWATCSGCHESEDGYDVGFYPHCDVFQCKLGGGCNECGGLGAVWDSTDWAEFADWSLKQDRTRKTIKATLAEKLRVYRGRIIGLGEAADAIMDLEPRDSAAIAQPPPPQPEQE